MASGYFEVLAELGYRSFYHFWRFSGNLRAISHLFRAEVRFFNEICAGLAGPVGTWAGGNVSINNSIYSRR